MSKTPREPARRVNAIDDEHPPARVFDAFVLARLRGRGFRARGFAFDEHNRQARQDHNAIGHAASARAGELQR